jgi:dipeptidyl aminopeptidase/acylaminoacyl peptidase
MSGGLKPRYAVAFEFAEEMIAMHPWVNVCRLAVMGVAMVFASAGVGAAPTTPSQALSYIRVSDLHFSANGTKLAYVESSYLWDVQPHVWIMDLITHEAHQLTPATKSERSPQWSPDGKQLAFLSNRAGKTQVYVVDMGGGEPTAVTDRKNGVTSFHWSLDGRGLAYVSQDDDAPPTDSGPQLADDERSLPRLWVLDLTAKKERRLGISGFRIEEFQWQDSSHLLIVGTDTPRVEANTDAVYRISTEEGSPRLMSRPAQPFVGLIVAPDGKRFAVRSTSAQGPDPRDLFIGTVGQDDLKNVSSQLGCGLIEARWQGAESLWLRSADGFYNRLWHFPLHGPAVPIPLKLSVSTFDVSHQGVVAFVGEDFAHLPEIYLRDRKGQIRQVGHVQSAWEGGELEPTTIFKTASFDATPIEAALVTPSAPNEGRKFPLVLLVHGGPDSNFSAAYSWEFAWAQLLAAHGYQVLLANPRGSIGYSEDFLKANRGDWGGGDYKDLIAVLDAVIARGNTDPNRLGIGGWSYGGEMSEWAITQTDRFKAAVVGAGVFDQQAEYETEHNATGDEWYFGTPWEHPDVYARNSPASYIGAAHTPTLIFGGEDDASNPVGQSLGLYRALKHVGIETQMVLFPGEGHSPRKGTYNLDMFQRLLEWYDRHLKGSNPQAERPSTPSH